MIKKICDRCGCTIENNELSSAHFVVKKVKDSIMGESYEESDFCARCYQQWIEFKGANRPCRISVIEDIYNRLETLEKRLKDEN